MQRPDPAHIVEIGRLRAALRAIRDMLNPDYPEWRIANEALGTPLPEDGPCFYDCTPCMDAGRCLGGA